MMNAMEFNKAVSKHCKDMSGDCCKCDLRLYCYLSPSERCDELISLVISFLHNCTENQTPYSHHSAASYPCICDMDMSNALGASCHQQSHNPQK